MTAIERAEMIRHALAARAHAYAPYSRFSVGAALLTEAGEIFVGCNVENASFGLTICAERVAFGTAVAAGHRRFQALALATSGGHAPCGACRQVAAEFGDNLSIFLVDADRTNQVIETSIRELLPRRFQFASANP